MRGLITGSFLCGAVVSQLFNYALPQEMRLIEVQLQGSPEPDSPASNCSFRATYQLMPTPSFQERQLVCFTFDLPRKGLVVLRDVPEPAEITLDLVCQTSLPVARLSSSHSS
ncbi:hypothetical protein FOZ63_010738, partial [Perkinsus olseni]